MKRDPDIEQPERIAFASSEPEGHAGNTVGGKPARWTELAVYYLHRPKKPGRPWRAVSRGWSTHPGERLREEVITVGTLERALGLFDEHTQLGRSVIAQAKDWDEENPQLTDAAWRRGQIAIGDEIIVPATGTMTRAFTPETQDEALRWLYGEKLDSAKPQTLLARDFGVKESTARMQLKNGRPVMVPLTAVIPFIDRFRFERARDEGGADNG